MPPHRLHATALSRDRIDLTQRTLAVRSLLIAPADDAAALAAALASEADALVAAFDVETNAGETARANAARLLQDRSRRKLLARVSPLASGLTDRDLDAAMSFAPAAILLPQCVGAADVQQLSVKLAVREAMLGLADGATGILALVDTAKAALAARSLCGASARLAGIAWDAQALRADVGAEGSRDGAPSGAVRLARDLALLAAAAARVPAFDAASAADGEALRAEALAARRDGFAGKLARDPAQAAVINAAFGAKG